MLTKPRHPDRCRQIIDLLEECIVALGTPAVVAVPARVDHRSVAR